MTTTTATAPATMPNSLSRLRSAGSAPSVLMRIGFSPQRVRSVADRGFRFRTMHQGEDDGNEQQRRAGCEDQAADDGASERRVLLAAFAQTERHRRHADDHGKR